MTKKELRKKNADRMTTWRKANPARWQAIAKRYYESHKVALAAKAKKYYETHKKEYAKRARKYYLAQKAKETTK